MKARTFKMQKLPMCLPLAWRSPTTLPLPPMTETVFSASISFGVCFEAHVCLQLFSAMFGALDSSSICCKRMQIFEKKGFTLGVVLLVVQSGHDKLVRIRVESTLMFAMKRPKTGAMKLPFGLCGCQEENSKGGELVEIEEETSDGYRGKEFQDSGQRIQLQVPLPSSSFVVLVDEWQTIKSGGDEIEKLLLNLRSLINQEQSMPIGSCP
ncbi:hypothetical protein JHK82_018205 [Glycine max]|nr:hypothetical protein JHK85_018630 [Glycine max]KAG5142510.1 hypothetical protein JHK82_018205 [Glycine max]